MLSQDHRLRRGADFARTLRSGVHAGRTSLVVHLLVDPSDRPARCGFVVSKAVGSAVVRNTVKRRLRELVRERITVLPPGSLLVVRARAAAADAGWPALGADLDSALRRVRQQATARQGERPRPFGEPA